MLDARTRDVLRLALPASLEAVIQLSFNFLAQLVVAALGATAVAAVGFSNNVLLVAVFTLGTLGTGAGILVARAHGAGDPVVVARVTGLALVLAALVSVPLALLTSVFATPVLRALGADAALAAATAPYFTVALLGMPLIVLSIVLGGVMRSLERPRLPMVATLVAAVLNVALGYALVHGVAFMPELGLVGAAWAALAGQGVRVGLLLVFVYGRSGLVPWAGPALSRRSARLVGELLHLSLPLAATQMAWSGGNLMYALILARLGTEALAGVQIVHTLEGIFIVASFGLVPAATALIGQAVGRGDARLAAEWARTVERFGVIAGLVFGALFALTVLALPALYPNVGAGVLNVAFGGILLAAAFQVVKVANMVRGGGVLPSGSDTRGVLIGDAVSAFLVGLPLAWALAFPLGYGVWGVLVARVLEELVKVVIFAWRARQLVWVKVVRAREAHAA